MAPETGKKPLSGLWKFAIDFGPLLVFFFANRFAPGDEIARAITATIAFMIAMTIGLILSYVKSGRIAPMLWFTAAIVLLFGGLTIWLHDAHFIQMKPTIIYTGFALILGIGLLRDKPLLKYILESGFPALDHQGWVKLTRNWMWFFIAMAIFNEAVRFYFSFDIWLAIKVWGVTALSFLFAMAQAPILMRHSTEDKDNSTEK